MEGKPNSTEMNLVRMFAVYVVAGAYGFTAL